MKIAQKRISFFLLLALLLSAMWISTVGANKSRCSCKRRIESEENGCSIPVISNLANTPSTTTCTITWDTDIDADHQVEYRKDGLGAWSYEPANAEGSTTSHEVILTGLDAEHELYQFMVKSDQGACEGSWNGPHTFYTTCAVPQQSGHCAMWVNFILGNRFFVTIATPCDIRVRYRVVGVGDWTTCNWSGSYSSGSRNAAPCDGTISDTSYEFQFEAKNKCGTSTGWSSTHNVSTDAFNKFISTC